MTQLVSDHSDKFEGEFKRRHRLPEPAAREHEPLTVNNR